MFFSYNGKNSELGGQQDSSATMVCSGAGAVAELAKPLPAAPVSHTGSRLKNLSLHEQGAGLEAQSTWNLEHAPQCGHPKRQLNLLSHACQLFGLFFLKDSFYLNGQVTEEQVIHLLAYSLKPCNS